ncbi:MAG: carboxypeptidase-like regulatory domain-containing protein [Bacteroidota bacterium]
MATAPKPKKGETNIAREIEIRGKVVDENNQPVPFASIMIKDKGLGVSADSSGVFSIIDPLCNEAIVLEVSSAGFETKGVSITKQADLSQGFLIQLKAAKMLDEVVVSSSVYIKGRTMIMGGISSVRYTKITEAIPVIKPAAETPAMIKVYPNPVMAGTTINIGCENWKKVTTVFSYSTRRGN